MNGNLKDTFIQRALQEYMARVIRSVQIDMQRKKVGQTGEAAQSLDSRVHSQTGELIFRQYLRFVDMGVAKSHPLGGLAKTKAVLLASRGGGEVFTKDRTVKPRKVYSKNAYGNLSWLQGKILYGYTEETIEMLKKELQGQ